MFYAAFPLWAGYAICIIKDTFYMAIVTNFVIDLLTGVDTIVSKERLSIQKCVIFVIEMLLMSMIRHEAKLLIGMLGVVLLVKYKYYRKQILLLGFVWELLFCSYSWYIYSYLGIPKGEIGEALSIPFQGTARYVKYFGDELTDEEYASINQVLPVDELAEAYNPILSDKVKARLRSGCNKKQYFQYALTWAKMGLKHPEVYIQAYWENYSGYLNPLYINSTINFGIDYGNQVSEDEELPIFHYKEESLLRDILIRYVNVIKDTPILGSLFAAGFYVWCIIVMWIWAIYKKLNKVPLVYPTLTIVICFMSAANGYLRYVLTVAAMLPLLIGYYKKHSPNAEKQTIN